MLRPREDGFTEDTTINLMRYDSKNKQRHVRFDRVLLKGDGWTPTEIELLGTEPISDAACRGCSRPITSACGAVSSAATSHSPKVIGANGSGGARG